MPGLAYLAVAKAGLFALQEDGSIAGVQPFTNHVLRMTRGPQGDLWVAELSSLYRVRDRSSSRIAIDGDHTWTAADGASAQDLWAIDFQEIGRLSGQRWAYTKLRELGDDEGTLTDVAVEGDGTVWIMSQRTLRRKTGAGPWEIVLDLRASKDAARKRQFFLRLGKSEGKLRYALASEQLFARDDTGTFKPIAEIAGPGALKLWVTHDGKALVRTTTGLLLVGPGGASRSVRLDDAGLANVSVLAAASDGRGRLWLGTDHGLAVLDADDRTLARFVPGSIPEVVDHVTEIVVVEGGPSTLPAPKAPATGLLQAKIYWNGAPVPNAAVELCPAPDMLLRAATPCAGAPLLRTAKTGQDGAIKIEDVPVGVYGLAVRTAERWRFTSDTACCTRVGPKGLFEVKSFSLL